MVDSIDVLSHDLLIVRYALGIYWVGAFADC
jgi:hypothetical protein